MAILYEENTILLMDEDWSVKYTIKADRLPKPLVGNDDTEGGRTIPRCDNVLTMWFDVFKI